MELIAKLYDIILSRKRKEKLAYRSINTDTSAVSDLPQRFMLSVLNNIRTPSLPANMAIDSDSSCWKILNEEEMQTLLLQNVPSMVGEGDIREAVELVGGVRVVKMRMIGDQVLVTVKLDEAGNYIIISITL